MSTLRGADYVASFLAERGIKAGFPAPGGGNMFLSNGVGQTQGLNLPVKILILEAGVQAVLAHEGSILCDIQAALNESLWPKAIAVPQPDGTILSIPLEDMTPLLPREELRAQMLVGLTEESEKVVA